MRNELDPQIGQWYAHLDKGQRFYVVAIDDEENTIEISEKSNNGNWYHKQSVSKSMNQIVSYVIFVRQI